VSSLNYIGVIMFTRQQNITGDARIPLELGQVGLTATASLSVRYILCTADGVPLVSPVTIPLTNAPNITGSWAAGNFGPLYAGSTSYLLRPPTGAFTSPRTLFIVVTPDGVERTGEIANPNYSELSSGSLTSEYANGFWNTTRGVRASGSFGFNLDAQVSQVSGSSAIINTGSIAAAVWAAAARTLTSSSVDTIATANAVWLAPVRTLTSSGTIDATTIATAVWNANRSVHQVSGTFGQGITTVYGVTGNVNGNVNGNITGSVALLGTNAIVNTSFATSATDRITNNFLDLADAIESNVTVRGALRVIAAALAGTTIGAGTSNITFRNIGSNSSNRITATIDPTTGERATITLNLP
jgi:hypothetical protein